MHLFFGVKASVTVYCLAVIASITSSSSAAFLSSASPALDHSLQKSMSTTLLCEIKSPIPPPPSVSLPVWSLAAPTSNQEIKEQTSMSIVTYAIPVSVAPPKLWIVSLYHGTLTKESFLSAGGGVLQLLSPEQKRLVFMGKQSGNDVSNSKADACSELGFAWTREHPFGGDVLSLLPACVSYVQLAVKDCTEAGDHVAVLCEVVQTGTWDDTNECIALSTNDVAVPLDQSKVLYSGLLRDEGLI